MRGEAARNFNRLVPTPFFGIRLRRQNFNLAPTQYRQLHRLAQHWSQVLDESQTCLEVRHKWFNMMGKL